MDSMSMLVAGPFIRIQPDIRGIGELSPGLWLLLYLSLFEIWVLLQNEGVWDTRVIKSHPP